MKNKVKKILDEIGVSNTLKGYYLWPELCEMALKEKENSTILITYLVRKLAYRTNRTFSTTEKNLRYFVESNECAIQEYFKYYPYGGSKITSKRFLMLILNKIEEREDER